MRNHLSAADLLSAWEHALGRQPVHQALALLGAAYPECPPEALAELTIGQRDDRLLTLRERLFGPRLNSVTTCPRCQQTVETIFEVSDIRARRGEPAPSGEPTGPITVTAEGYRVVCRLPNSRDLTSIDPSSGTPAGVALLKMCIQSAVRERAGARGDETIADVSRLPASVVHALAERLVEADPQADTRLTLRCPECDHLWSATFDIAAYLISEVHAWARRLLREVHYLAHAYGWSEAEILAMSPLRRRAYLELLGFA
jgi:hypothetical protein